jgi:cytochrome c5
MKPTLVLSGLLAVAFGLSGCGRSDAPDPSATPAAPASVATAPATPAEPAAAANPVGASVYNKTCALCHAAGVGGAPKPGDKADWGPRIAQGEETLFKHALEGFTGAKGAMPARGGSPSLSDEDVKAAVTHMMNLSR